MNLLFIYSTSYFMYDGDRTHNNDNVSGGWVTSAHSCMLLSVTAEEPRWQEVE